MYELQYKIGRHWKTLYQHESSEYLECCKRGYTERKWRILKLK